MTDTTATDAELIESIAYALRYRSNGRAAHDHANAAAVGAASHIVAMLRRSGYRVTKGPPAPAHSAQRYGLDGGQG